MSITELAIKRPILIIVVFLALILVGVFAYFQLNYELLPSMSAPYVIVTTVYAGASPQVVETQVTKVLEDAVSTLDNVKNIYSYSHEGVSFITIEFNNSANVNIALQDSQRKVNGSIGDLPDDAETPVLQKFAIDELPVMRLGASSALPPREFYRRLKDQVVPQLSRVPGVGQISLIGGEEREIRVNVDQQKLRSLGLSILQVSQAIKSANLDFPTGKVKEGDHQFVVRLAGKLADLAELRALVVGRARGDTGDVRLGDLAEITDGVKEMTNFSRLNNVSTVGILVQKQSNANNVDVCRRLRRELARVESASSDAGVRFDVASDSSLFTEEAVTAVRRDLMIAILMVAAVMFLFLHSIRNSLIVMVAVPTSLISTLIAMWAFGFSLNLMTLLAMSLVIGILVDDSIVVLENIYRHLEMGEPSRLAALRGRSEIGFTAVAITMVDVVVFLPLSLISGIIGSIVREYSLVIVVSTLMSLFVSFTLTPMLASRFTHLQNISAKTLAGKSGLRFEAAYNALTGAYHRALAWGLGHRKAVIAAAVALVAGSIALVPLGFVGTEFMTKSDRGEFSVYVELAEGATLERTNQVTQDVERMLARIPEVRKVFTNVGASNEGFFAQSSSNVSEIDVSLVDKRRRRKSQEEIGQEIRAMVSRIPGVKVRVNPIGLFGQADEAPIQYVISGVDRDEVRRTADRMAAVTKEIPGTVDVRLSSSEGQPETRVEIDRDKMASLGLSIGEVGATLRTALTGDAVSKFKDGNDEYDIRVVLDQFDRRNPDDVAAVTFTNSRGETIDLRQFAAISQASGPTKLERKNRNNSIQLMAQTLNRPSGAVNADILRGMAREKVPAGVSIAPVGDIEMMTDSFKSLALALLAAIISVYMVMVALYNSWVYPFVILFSIPLAVVGAILALALTGNSINIFSFMGMIMLVGLVAKNAIILVDFTNRLRRDGMPTAEALLQAGRTRLRPILMTTATMIFGMLPIALSIGSASEMKRGFAWVLIGGLTSSLLLTLILVPVVYVMVVGVRDRVVRTAPRPEAEAGAALPAE
ncbi:MAG TPA: efflux RND transporter permease subunit [Terriglobales bacterium]|nr:efflux RND transporter permease subunit [Terriglobales bacterium]